MAKIDLSLILPCYNEGPTFENSITQILTVLKKLNKTWEIIFVEDKSLDETKKFVERLISQIEKLHFRQGFSGQARAIYHLKNQGRGKSVSDGIKAANGEICGYLDVDLEVSASYIPLFIKEVEKGNDIVIGQRFYEGGSTRTIMRFLASKIYALAVKLFFNLPVEDTETGYKFFKKKKILPVLSQVKNKHWFWDTEICIRAFLFGLKISQIPVLFRRREDKESTVRLLPDSIDYVSNLIRLKKELMSKV